MSMELQSQVREKIVEKRGSRPSLNAELDLFWGTLPGRTMPCMTHCGPNDAMHDRLWSDRKQRDGTGDVKLGFTILT